MRIRGWGKSGHAAMPEGTVNAISLIVDCLLKSGVCTPQEEAYLNVLHTLHADTDGSAVTATAFNVSLNVILCDKGGVQP